MLIFIILLAIILILSGWLVGSSYLGDSPTDKTLSWLNLLLVTALFIVSLLAYKDMIIKSTIFEHYQIQEEVTTTTYKIVPNGV